MNILSVQKLTFGPGKFYFNSDYLPFSKGHFFVCSCFTFEHDQFSFQVRELGEAHFSLFIDRVALRSREIMGLVAFVCLSVCLSAFFCLTV